MLQLVAQAKLTWHGTHVLRKTCWTRIADGGGGVAAVATHLRHKNLQTASRYIDRRGAGPVRSAGPTPAVAELRDEAGAVIAVTLGFR